MTGDGRIVVVGAGVIGASVASHLRHLDRPVTVVERDQPGGHTTRASASHVTLHQHDPERRTHRRRTMGRDWYREHSSSGEFDLETVGTIEIARDGSGLDHLRRLGEELEALGVETTLYRESTNLRTFAIADSSATGGLWLPGEGPVDQVAVVDYLLGEARRGGVEVRSQTAVTDVRVANGRVTGVLTEDGLIEADRVVNAAGPWAPVLNEMVGVDLPLRHTPGPMATVKLEVDSPIRLPLVLLPDGHYLRRSPAHDDGVLVGAFDTDYSSAERFPPSALTGGPEDGFGERATGVVERVLSPRARPRVLEQWRGVRTVTPDGRPIVDRTPVEGFLVACGMSGYGVTLAPAVGDLFGEWIRTGERPRLLSDLGHDRFEAVETGGALG